MAKVFRPYNIQGNNSIIDWDVSKSYGSKAISEIMDPEGATATKEITSIPSPFARIDLVKTAFKEVVDMVRQTPHYEKLSSGKVCELISIGTQNAPTIYHKMVSEALDVAEIFFNHDRFSDKFEILVWDREIDLDTRSVLGKTLDRYLQSDADAYNFNRMNRIYMLNYIGPGRPSELNIVGATSPSTLFFSSANDLHYVAKNVAFGQDRPFDNDYNPLFKRDFEFQKYLFAFRKANGGIFARLFPEVNAYLDITYQCLSDKQKFEIDNLNENSVDIYDPITIGQKGADTLEILGMPFHKKTQAAVGSWSSDFEIASTIATGQRPLVLPVEAGNNYAKMRYTTDIWGNTNKAPYYDDEPLLSRRLPVVNETYPYLTVSDFLTETIVRMPYEINGDNFYDGGYRGRAGDAPSSYLLPLNDLFFNYFTSEELQKEVANGKKMLEIGETNSGVKVTLRIPVKRGFVEYTRVYFEGVSPNIENNDGALIDTKIGMGVLPLVRFPEGVNVHYRIAFFDKGKNDATLACYSGNKEVEVKRVIRAEKDLQGRGCSHEAYVVEQNFDRVKVRIGEAEGLIVPRFKTKGSSVKYTFAVDFGTTNTHIEFCTDSKSTPVPFCIKRDEVQIHKLHKLYTDPDIRLAFEQDFIPDTIGDGDKYSFPMRTVFAERTGIDYLQSPMPLVDGNIPFLYERDFTPNWNNIKTELKWGGVHERLLEMHLETLFILMRNKVVLNDGNLADTKIIWFYPASMTLAKINQFKRIWKDAYEKYFGSDSSKNIISISESKAPYQHFIKTMGAADEVVTIDIGGGTTDVFVVERQQDKMLLSFRFASNAIFGDGYNSNPSKNGFVGKYKNEFKGILEKNGMIELNAALSQIEEQQKSSDIIAFLFSLAGDKVKGNKELDFMRTMAKDDKMRYVFIIFYGAILYFIAKTMKARGLMKPKTIAFSGNGARTLSILSDDMETVESFAKHIFDGVYGDKNGKIEVLMEKNPKIATCKGGIEIPTPQPYDEIGQIKTVFVGNDFDRGESQTLTYGEITNEVKQEVVSVVKEFFGFLFDMHKANGDYLVNYLGASPDIFDWVRDFCLGEEGSQLLEVSMEKGVRNKCEVDRMNDETALEETLFFYPLVVFLHDLAYDISKK